MYIQYTMNYDISWAVDIFAILQFLKDVTKATGESRTVKTLKQNHYNNKNNNNKNLYFEL